MEREFYRNHQTEGALFAFFLGETQLHWAKPCHAGTQARSGNAFAIFQVFTQIRARQKRLFLDSEACGCILLCGEGLS